MLGLNMLTVRGLLLVLVAHAVASSPETTTRVGDAIHLPNLNGLLLRILNLIHHIQSLVGNRRRLLSILSTVVGGTLPLFRGLIQSVGACRLSKPCSTYLREHAT